MDTLLKQRLKDAGYVGEFDLQSLIEACGDRFVSISDFGAGDGEDIRYRVFGKDNKGNCSGKTPVEAVANFWLELKKK